MFERFVSMLTGTANEYRLSIPRLKERQGVFVFGDSGTGKSQFIHRIIGQVRERQEPGVCFDPAAEFVKTYYRENLDYILNPLDERFPNWEVGWEIESPTDLDLLAESFIPTAHIREQNTRFFKEAAQDIFKLMLARKWSNEKLIAVLCDEAAIEEIVQGTEVAYKMGGAGSPQRFGALGTLADIGKLLRLIPLRSDKRKNFSLTSWVRKRKNEFLFLTTTADTRDTLRPFNSAMLNILMRRLMSDSAGREKTSTWFIADELHNLNSLSALPEFMVECRKHGICYVMGTQSKYQLIPQYGENTRTMLSSPALKIFYRCNEAEGARWISECIGDEEYRKPHVSTSVPLGEGRESTNFSTVLERRPVVSKEQIMNLPDLHAYWSFEDRVVPFRLEYLNFPQRNHGFISRPVRFRPPVKNSGPAAKTAKEMKLQSSAKTDNEIDLNF